MIDSLPDVGLEGILVTGLIGLIFAGVAAIFFAIGWINLRRAQASRQWPQVLGRVTAARVDQSSDSEGGTSYQAHVEYAYDVGGRTFVNARRAFGGEVSHGSPRNAEQTTARYPAGALVQVYYNPANPQDAVLERRSGMGGFMFGMGAVFLLLGCGLPLCLEVFFIGGWLARAAG